MAQFIRTQSTLVLVVAVPAIYLLLVALGRWLKRRAGVRLGVFYQLFCIVVAVFVPLTVRFEEVNFIVLQALGSAVAMLGTVFLLALIRRFFWEYYLEQRRRVHAPKFMHDALALLVFGVAFLLVLTFIFEIKIPGLLAGSGILAVVLGFAMQDMLGNIIGGFALQLESPQALLNDIMTEKLYGLPADYWDTYPQKIAAIAQDDVQRVAKKYLDLGHLQVVAVGDASKITDVLKQYGTVEIYDTEGKPVKTTGGRK